MAVEVLKIFTIVYSYLLLIFATFVPPGAYVKYSLFDMEG